MVEALQLPRSIPCCLKGPLLDLDPETDGYKQIPSGEKKKKNTVVE